jgi:hypothetical protein
MRFDQPLAGAAQLQPSAVHQQMHRFDIGLRSRHLQRLAPPAQRGMVRDGEIQTKQANDGAEQAFGPPQGQAKSPGAAAAGCGAGQRYWL